MTILILLMFLVSVFQSDRNDRGAAFVFVTPVIIYELFGKYVPDGAYYIGAGALSFSALWILKSYFWNKLADKLSHAMFISILINFVGFTLLHYKLDPDPYNSIFLVYYSWVLCIFIKEGGLHAGITKAFWNNVGLYRDVIQGVAAIKEEM